MMVDGGIDFELTRVIDGGFNPQYAAFVIHFDTVGLQPELYPAAHGAVLVVGDCLSLKPRVRFAPHEGKDIGASEIVECVTNQRGIDILEETALLKHDIGCEPALIHAPVVALPECFLDSVKKRVDGFRKNIKMSAELLGIKLVRKFLCLCHVGDIGEGIVITLVRDVVFAKDGLHPFPAVYADLDVKREPCLYFYKHEPIYLVQVIKIVMKTLGLGGFNHQLPIIVSIDLSGFAGFQCLEDTDQPAVGGGFSKDFFPPVRLDSSLCNFFWNIYRHEIKKFLFPEP